MTVQWAREAAEAMDQEHQSVEEDAANEVWQTIQVQTMTQQI
jgi:hypothetical protein